MWIIVGKYHNNIYDNFSLLSFSISGSILKDVLNILRNDLAKFSKPIQDLGFSRSLLTANDLLLPSSVCAAGLFSIYDLLKLPKGEGGLRETFKLI